MTHRTPCTCLLLLFGLTLAACSGSNPQMNGASGNMDPVSHTYTIDSDGKITMDGMATNIGDTVTFQTAGSDVAICVYRIVDEDTEVLTTDLFGVNRIDIPFNNSSEVTVTPPANGQYGFLIETNPEDFVCPDDDDKGDKPGPCVSPGC